MIWLSCGSLVVIDTQTNLFCLSDVASGSSFDYAKEKLNIAYAYGPELRPATAGEGGFDIPPSNITPSGREIFAGIVATVTNAQHKV